MSERLVTPKFLTAKMAEVAVGATLRAVFSGPLRDALRPHRNQLHVVVLVPGMTDHREEGYPNWPDYPLKAVTLYEKTRGNPQEFPYPFVEIAQCKALQLWTDRNDDRTDCVPHLLFPGDTPYWGGVKRRGIVVACSGLKPWVDKLISGMVADMLVAMAHAAWINGEDHANEANFLT